jgi:hypothetical protein
MAAFYIVRLGKDSEPAIRAIDNEHGKLAAPLDITLQCKQVPAQLAEGDFVFVWLGSNNNQGTPTEWKQGLRAVGKLVSRSGGAQFNDTQELGLNLPLALPGSVNHQDLLAHSPAGYYWISNTPVLGLNTHSNQTVQAIKGSDPLQDVRALLYSLEIVNPGFKNDIASTYPELLPLFSYTPSDPTAVKTSGAQELSDGVTTDVAPPVASLPANWIMSLASKGFLLVSGPSGTGKSKTGRDIARAFDYPLSYAYTASHRAARPSNSLAFVSVGADWTDGTPLLGFRNLFGAPRKVSSEDSAVSNERWDAPPAMRLMLRAFYKPDHPHFLVLDEMNLSHVERYFGDLLSVLEANRGLSPTDKIKLLDAGAIRLIADTLSESAEYPLEAEIAKSLAAEGHGFTLPDNLFIIGTVNVDETTYMFSPKVLDRAHVLEMSAPDPILYLNGEAPPDEDALPFSDCLAMLQRSIARKREGFWERQVPFALLRQVIGTTDEAQSVCAAIQTLLDGLQRLLSPIGFSFAYRTINEICSYMAVYFECSQPDLFKRNDIPGWVTALDRAVLQKVLPRLHGNRRLLGTGLNALEQFLKGQKCSFVNGQEIIVISEEKCIPVALHQSALKLRSMAARLEATGYTTFVS